MSDRTVTIPLEEYEELVKSKGYKQKYAQLEEELDQSNKRANMYYEEYNRNFVGTKRLYEKRQQEADNEIFRLNNVIQEKKAIINNLIDEVNRPWYHKLFNRK